MKMSHATTNLPITVFIYIFPNRHIYKLYNIIFLGRRRRPNSEEKEEQRGGKAREGEEKAWGRARGAGGARGEERKGREKEKERKSTLSAMIYLMDNIPGPKSPKCVTLNPGSLFGVFLSIDRPYASLKATKHR